MGGEKLILVTFSVMKQTVLSIFVDESGRFQYPDDDSRFYILGMVFHDQNQSIDEQIRVLDASELEIGLEGHCFHAGPLIRKEKGYEYLQISSAHCI